MGQGHHGRIRALIWLGDVENSDIGRHLDPSDLKEGQPLRGPRFSTVQFVTRPVPNGLRLVRFGMGDGKGQGRNTAKVKAAHGGVNGANCTKQARTVQSQQQRMRGFGGGLGKLHRTAGDLYSLAILER